jgi:WD repeat-containing protein 48
MEATVNLGKWVLRWLFSSLIDEEIKRDSEYRKSAVANAEELRALRRANAPRSIDLPAIVTAGAYGPSDFSAATPRVPNGWPASPVTPGLSIGFATPGPVTFITSPFGSSPLPATEEEGSNPGGARQSHDWNRPSSEKSNDYFSGHPSSQTADTERTPLTSTDEQTLTALPQSPAEPEKEEKKRSGSLFGKKFRMDFPKKLGRNSSDVKTPVQEEKTEESDKSSEKEEEKVFESNLRGVIERIRHDYETFLLTNPQGTLISGINPSREDETPILEIPSHTVILIQEESGDTAVAADLYRGSVGTVREEVDKLEKSAPHWLGELLLKVSAEVQGIDHEMLMAFTEPNTSQGCRQSGFHLEAVWGPSTSSCEA